MEQQPAMPSTVTGKSVSRRKFVELKYRLTELADIEMQVNGTRLGKGPLMSAECLQRFIDADPSGNMKYLDWMLFQAGGGQAVMEKMLALWFGDGPEDTKSLRAVARQVYIEDRVAGYEDIDGTVYPPINKTEAEAEWVKNETRILFETIMADQDIANEDGFGFHRNWPGRNNIYEKVINSVKLWHDNLSKLKAQNERLTRYNALKDAPKDSLSAEDAGWLAKQDTATMPKEMVELDIYKGWHPEQYSQDDAHYKDLDDLLRSISDLQRQQVKNDTRHVTVYESDLMVAVCPLTIGASVKYGSLKWCVSNLSEFDRGFADGGGRGHWAQYTSQGPLVFVKFKVPMPEYLSMVAIHCKRGDLRSGAIKAPWENLTFYDLQNNNQGTGGYANISGRILKAHTAASGGEEATGDEAAYRWGGRKPGRAWASEAEGRSVLNGFDELLRTVATWAPKFDLNTLICDYATGQTAAQLVGKE